MSRKIGDVRHGYVESAWSRFVYLGDQKSILETLIDGLRISRQQEQEPLREVHNDGYVRIQTIHGAGYVASRFLWPNSETNLT
jgi:hypothetical protein